MHCLAKLRADIERELSPPSFLLRCAEEIWPPENQSFQAPMHHHVAARSNGRHQRRIVKQDCAVLRGCAHRTSVQQASLPKNNGARELVDPYVIVGGVQHWKTKPRAYSAAAQATVFFAVSLTY